MVAERVEAELDMTDRGRVGIDLVVGGDLGDPSREVDVLLGHPSDNMFSPITFTVDGVVTDQLKVDVPIADRRGRVVTERVARLPHRGDEPRTGAEVVNQIASMQSLSRPAPVGEVRLDDLLPVQHIHGRGAYRISDSATTKPQNMLYCCAMAANGFVHDQKNTEATQ